jgi:N4-gp56 family major capsid protein
MFSWTFDAPTGTYKNHELSSKLRIASIAQTKFLQFIRPEPGYGKKKGETITITRLSNLTVPSNGRISENNRIPEDNMVLTTVAITVSEWGRAVPYTSLSSDLGKFDPESMIQKKLKDQMALVLDSAGAAAHKTGQIKAEATGATSINFDTAGTATQQAVSNLQVYHVEQIRDYLFSTLWVPPYENDDYVGLVSTKAKRGVINDPAWEIWHKYTDPQAKWNGEIGRIENIRFIEINNTNALSASLGSNGVCGEAIFMGEDGVAMAVAEDPELRAAIPQDFGRARSVAWYGILEFGMVWTTASAGEAKVIHLTST